MRRRLLLITFFFPPIGGVTVPRMLGAVLHLPAHGWEATVLTPRGSAYHLQDPGLEAAIPPGTRVVRTGIIEPAGMRRFVSRALKRGSAPGSATRDAARPTFRTGRMERIRRTLFFPDDQLLWLPFALVAALREHRRRPLSAILSSSSPVTAHLAGGLLARSLRLPWVAEFRDPWVGNPLAHRLPWFHRQLQRRLERWIVSNAARCVFVTPSLTAMYQRRYPAIKDRFVTVTNGYDLAIGGLDGPAADAGDAAPPVRGPGDPVTLLYAGTYDRPLELEIFLEGLRRYDAQRGGGPRVHVEFVGHASDACLGVVAGATDLADLVTVSGYVAREVALRRVAAADGALLLLGTGPDMGLFIGGKLYDYIGMSRPLLAMLPAGDARQLLEGLRWGSLAWPEADSVCDAIKRFVASTSGGGVADPNGLYERGAIVARLAVVLDEATEASP